MKVSEGCLVPGLCANRSGVVLVNGVVCRISLLLCQRRATLYITLLVRNPQGAGIRNEAQSLAENIEIST